MIPFMGMNEKNMIGLGDALFSKTQRQVLGLLFGNPERSYYLNEIIQFAGVGIGSVQRELEKLSRVGVLSVRRIGNQKHYQANHDSPIFEELRGIVLKTFGLGDVLRQALAGVAGQIKVAFIFGSVAKGTDTAGSDIDLMLIAESLSYHQVFTVLAAIEGQLGRTLSPTLYTPAEFQAKLAADNHFLKRIVEQPKLFLIGTPDDLAKP